MAAMRVKTHTLASLGAELECVGTLALIFEIVKRPLSSRGYHRGYHQIISRIDMLV